MRVRLYLLLGKEPKGSDHWEEGDFHVQLPYLENRLGYPLICSLDGKLSHREGFPR